MHAQSLALIQNMKEKSQVTFLFFKLIVELCLLINLNTFQEIKTKLKDSNITHICRVVFDRTLAQIQLLHQLVSFRRTRQQFHQHKTAALLLLGLHP